MHTPRKRPAPCDAILCPTFLLSSTFHQLVPTGERVAIEVDGPHHFMRNTRRPLGELKARQRLLQARTWTVISVPFFEWSACESLEAHKTYLQQASEGRSVCTLPVCQMRCS